MDLRREDRLIRPDVHRVDGQDLVDAGSLAEDGVRPLEPHRRERLPDQEVGERARQPDGGSGHGSRRMRSSPGSGLPRPSRFEVVTHSEPSGARATVRMRP